MSPVTGQSLAGSIEEGIMRESYFWHKVHSLTGVVPTGFYLVQHLTLNSFSLAGPEKFNGVPNFFESLPTHVLLFLKFGVVWPALLFHAIYGFFIISRGEGNYSEKALRYRENRYYTLQRASGIFAFVFLCWHLATTSLNGMINGIETIHYETWAERLAAPGGTYLMLIFYILGITASSYHFAYGIWNFCIRWGITVSEKAQDRVGKFSAGLFVAVAGIGILALVGFFKPILQHESDKVLDTKATPVERPVNQSLDNQI